MAFSSLAKPLHFTIRQTANMLRSSDFVRSIVFDYNNNQAFSDLVVQEKMMGNMGRINANYEAIRRAVKPGDVVVDFGTGNGILAMFAAQCKPKKIYALDHSDFIEIAKEVADYNGYGHLIEFLQINSRDFSLSDEKADIIIQDQMGEALFDENMLDNVLDLKRRVLKPQGRILPARFQLFLEPVNLKFDHKAPFIWEQNLHGVDFSCLRDHQGLQDYQYQSYRMRKVANDSVEKYLCNPEPLLGVDLHKIDDKDEVAKQYSSSRVVQQDGTLDGFVAYFKVIFDDDIGYDTAPLNTNTHWQARLFRTEQKVLSAGQTINYQLKIDNFVNPGSWSVDLI